MTAGLPTGDVSFLFTDIEGSTRMLREHGDKYSALLERHNVVIRKAISRYDGVVVLTEGDAFFVAFTDPVAAALAAVAAQLALAEAPPLKAAGLRVRMGLHSGVGALGGDNYVGMDVHIAARTSAAANGQQILATEALARRLDDRADEISALPLGSFWLKDISEPTQIFELTAPSLPTIRRPISAAPLRPRNTPANLSTFIGRDADIQRTLRGLEAHRLVTLTGPGGTGKTRLALEAGARAAASFPDGAVFVPLAGISEPESIPLAMLDALDAPPPGPGVAPLDHLHHHAQHMNLLLIIDNLEQVLAAGPLVAELLAAAPDTRVLATSRAPLGVGGEQELSIPPLSMPASDDATSPEQLLGFDAIRLFVERAASVRSDFVLDDSNANAIRQIAERLDGLPLAIELTAVRTRMMSPAAILRTLDPMSLNATGSDHEARHRSLRDTIAWSFDLLPEAEQRLLARLSVFIGGADIEQIDAVCEPGAIGLDPVDGIGSLVSQSLLVADDTEMGVRFRMLATIRDFGAAMLRESGDEAATRVRHVGAFVALAEEAGQHLETAARQEWMDRLAIDNANLDAALSHACATADADSAQRIVAAAWRYWQVRGLLDTAADHAQRALQLNGAPATVRARALDAAGGIAYWRGDIDATRRHYDEALEVHRMLGDPLAIANALLNLAFLESRQHGTASAITFFDEAIALFEASGDVLGLSGAYRARAAQGLFDAGATPSAERTDAVSEPEGSERAARLQRAMEDGRRSLTYAEQLGDPLNVAWAQSVLGGVELIAGRTQEGLDRSQEALRSFNQLDDVAAIAIVLATIADFARRAGDRAGALYLAGGVTKLWDAVGVGRISPFDASIADFVSEGNLSRLGDEELATYQRGRDAGRAAIVDHACAYRLV